MISTAANKADGTVAFPEIPYTAADIGKTHSYTIVERADGAVVACEVKLASSVQDSDTKHLHWLKKTIGDRLLDAIVINTGPRAYRRPDGIGVVPLALLGV